MENTINKGQKDYVADLMNPPKDYVMDPESKKKLIEIGIDANEMERRIRINVIDRFFAQESGLRQMRERSEKYPEIYGSNKREIKYSFKKAS